MSRRLVGWLVVLSSAEELSFKDFRLLDGKNTIGRRGARATVEINDGRISTEHAILVFNSGKYRLTDLGSANGTHVNGEPIDSVELQDGDRLKVGRDSGSAITNAGGVTPLRRAQASFSAGLKQQHDFQHCSADPQPQRWPLQGWSVDEPTPLSIAA